MMKNPCHPGEILQDSFGPDGLNITVTEAARHLGVSRVTLSRVLNGKAAVSADLALRLERSGISTARTWLAVQSAYDLSQAAKRKQPRIRLFVSPEVPKIESTEAKETPSRFNPVPIRGEPMSVTIMRERGSY